MNLLILVQVSGLLEAVSLGLKKSSNFLALKVDFFLKHSFLHFHDLRESP